VVTQNFQRIVAATTFIPVHAAEVLRLREARDIRSEHVQLGGTGHQLNVVEGRPLAACSVRMQRDRARRAACLDRNGKLQPLVPPGDGDCHAPRLSPASKLHVAVVRSGAAAREATQGVPAALARACDGLRRIDRIGGRTPMRQTIRTSATPSLGEVRGHRTPAHPAGRARHAGSVLIEARVHHGQWRAHTSIVRCRTTAEHQRPHERHQHRPTKHGNPIHDFPIFHESESLPHPRVTDASDSCATCQSCT
jgi:hypothetical protein